MYKDIKKKGISINSIFKFLFRVLELLLDSKKPISKNFIQKTVWEYSEEADTHTVETHIYRLRKKIADEFMDEKFILNSKDGYYL